jgi:hypothetical protein
MAFALAALRIVDVSLPCLLLLWLSQALREFCKATTKRLGHEMLAGSIIWIYWWDEPRVRQWVTWTRCCDTSQPWAASARVGRCLHYYSSWLRNPYSSCGMTSCTDAPLSPVSAAWLCCGCRLGRPRSTSRTEMRASCRQPRMKLEFGESEFISVMRFRCMPAGSLRWAVQASAC